MASTAALQASVCKGGPKDIDFCTLMLIIKTLLGACRPSIYTVCQRCVQECWLPPMICFVSVCACVLRSGLHFQKSPFVRSGKESCGCQQLEARKRNEFVLQGLGLLECPSVPSAPAVFGSSSTSTSPLLCSAWKRA